MQSDHIIRLIKGQDTPNIHSLSELAALVDEFSYFQTAHLLYTLNLKEIHDSRYYAQLRKTACYMTDRTQLFYLVEKEFAGFLKKESQVVKDPESILGLIDSFLAKQEKKQKPDSSDDPEIATHLIQTDYLSYPLLQAIQEEKEIISAPSLKHQETIDKFLAEDEKSPIKIELPKEEKQEEEVFPDLDSTEESDFFSETLAKIYLKQKKYEKALEIIRKLNLIYPEKNRYFADQIRFLEKLIINIKK